LQEEAFEVVAGSAVSVFMGQGRLELFGGKILKHAAGDEQARTKQAGHGEKRSFVFDQHYRRRFSGQARFLAGEPAKPIVAQGSEEGPSGSREGVEPSRSAEQSQKATHKADSLGSGRGFEPEITRDTQSQDEEYGKRKRKQAQAHQKSGGSHGRS
jgi:hypothetical protein